MTPAAPPKRRTLAYLAGIPVDEVGTVGPKRARRLGEAGIRSVADLLLVPPLRYLDRSRIYDIALAPEGVEVTVAGVVSGLSRRRIRGRRVMTRAVVSDGTGRVQLTWFHPHVPISDGDRLAVAGKLERFRGALQMTSPAFDRLDAPRDRHTGRILPVYGTTGGVKPNEMRRALENAVPRALPIVDVLPDEALDRLDLVDRSFAVSRLHFPETMDDVAPARRRLTFDEFLRIQMALRVRAHDDFETQVGVHNSIRGPLLDRYLGSLPFDLTPDQRRALDEILADMADGTPLHRLLQGEVGSGKTVVVVAALLTSIESGHQAAFMAPTEVLATQHYLGTAQSLREASMAPTSFVDDLTGTASLFADESLATRPVRIALFTSGRVTVNFRHADVSRAQGLAWLADGTIDMAFGTHALIQPDVSFHSLGITVVDEQHRFGVEQRVRLRDADTSKGVPDLLLMTATPIPRTFVMALYGDLDVSTIRTMPPGRAPVATRVLAADGRAEAAVDEAVARTVASGRQAFVVCPLVDDSDKIDARSATGEHRRMSASLDGVRVGLLHGQMTSEEKSAVMDDIRAGTIDALVATTVVEVGIDVPNATLIVVWNAERFGLSQLHQLRGRVGRGAHRGRCLLVGGGSTDDADRRLHAMEATNDGFELAKVDLEIRGHGTLFGTSQSGIGDLRFGDLLRDTDLIEAAASLARHAVETDRDGPLVAEIMDEVSLIVGDAEEWLAKS